MQWDKAKVPFRDLRHFTHKACMTSVNAEANAHSADWLMSVFVNELTLPHVRGQQGQCVQQCRRIMKETLHIQIPPDWLRGSYITQYPCGYSSRSTAEGTMRVLWSYSIIWDLRSRSEESVCVPLLWSVTNRHGFCFPVCKRNPT